MNRLAQIPPGQSDAELALVVVGQPALLDRLGARRGGGLLCRTPAHVAAIRRCGGYDHGSAHGRLYSTENAQAATGDMLAAIASGFDETNAEVGGQRYSARRFAGESHLSFSSSSFSFVSCSLVLALTRTVLPSRAGRAPRFPGPSPRTLPENACGPAC